MKSKAVFLILLTIVIFGACSEKHNNAPVTVNDGPFNVETNSNISIDVLMNDSDDHNAIDKNSLRVSEEPQKGTVSLQAGKFVYTAASIVGQDSFKYTVKDDSANISDDAFVSIEVFNSKPRFSSSPPLSAIININYSYPVIVIDSSNQGSETLQITAKVLPNWLKLANIGNETALLSGTPSKDDLGTSSVVLQVSDGVNEPVSQEFVVTVSSNEATLGFSSQPIIKALVDQEYDYKITTFNDNKSNVAITATTKPTWLTLNDNGDGSASLTGTASEADLGPNSVILAANDSINNAEQSFIIVVDKKSLPVLSVAPVSIKEGNKGNTELVFRLILSENSEGDTGVNFITKDVTAVAGQDYESKSGTISFPKGSNSAEVRISIIGDKDVEDDEAFKLEFSNAKNLNLDKSDVMGTILNDDSSAAQIIPNPIVFVTQFPIQEDFTTITSTFGNHKGEMQSAGRGGDLWIIYEDGSRKNLTKAAGYGVDGFQNKKAISVRDPEVHWGAKKVIFSMVIGAPERYKWEDYYWQIYEITNLDKDQTPVITKLANQPQNYNNITPIYTSNDDIIFTSDRPRDGQRHLYPQLDEYEEAPVVSGLWRLDRNSSKLTLLDHAPSGVFTPILDSFGRVIFTQWDHLVRDQQADTDALNGGQCHYCTFNYSGESPDSIATNSNAEVFPEPRSARKDLLEGSPYTGHEFNHFLPWMIFQEGSELEVINHIGKHELLSYANQARNDDPSLESFIFENHRGKANHNVIENFFEISENPSKAGYFIGINTEEFGTHGAGQIIGLYAPSGLDGDRMKIDYFSNPSTKDHNSSSHKNTLGMYREPIFLSDGKLLASYSSGTDSAKNLGTREHPRSNYNFRLYLLKKDGQYWNQDIALTDGIKKDITYYDPDYLVQYSDNLWELSPVEIVVRKRPPTPKSIVPNIERSVFNDVGVSVSEFQNYLIKNNLALIISRDITVRDDADLQQPYNLRVTGTNTKTIGNDGKIYDVSYMQYFQGSLIRSLSYGNASDPIPGRRVLAQELDSSYNGNNAGPPGSVVVASDGSIAAFVPAERAMVWQLTDASGEGVVRERNWVTFKAGEIRVCAACHGLNQKSQSGGGLPTNSPLALKDLLEKWKLNH